MAWPGHPPAPGCWRSCGAWRTFLFLDGGELDFGIVRDSTLNARNDFRLMVETFEALGYVGGESLELTLSGASGEMGARRAGGAALVCPV